MTSFHSRSVTRSRKPRPCFWCGETIDSGASYKLWRCADGDTTLTINVHPECSKAWTRASVHGEGDDIERGSMERGTSNELEVIHD